jgi:hypothetical protein
MNYVEILKSVISTRPNRITKDFIEKKYRFASIRQIQCKLESDTYDSFCINSLHKIYKELGSIGIIEVLSDPPFFKYGLKELDGWDIEGDYFVRELDPIEKLEFQLVDNNPVIESNIISPYSTRINSGLYYFSSKGVDYELKKIYKTGIPPYKHWVAIEARTRAEIMIKPTKKELIEYLTNEN